LNKTKIVTVGVIIVAVLVVAVAVSTGIFHSMDQPSFRLNGVAGYVYPTSNYVSYISVRVGETFIAQFSSTGSAGYDWKVTTSSGIQYLNFTVVSTSHLPGGSQVRNYFFKAVQPGSQTITMQDQRVFAPYNTLSTVSIRVSVS